MSTQQSSTKTSTSFDDVDYLLPPDKIISIKKEIIRFFNVEAITDRLLDAISKSNAFYFLSERSVRLINKQKPRFHLKFIPENFDPVNIRKFNSEDVSVKHDSVISEFIDTISFSVIEEMNDVLEDPENPEYQYLLKEPISGLSEKDIEIAQAIITSIVYFTVTFSNNEVLVDIFN